MLKFKIASLVLASIMVIGSTRVTTFAADAPVGTGDSVMRQHGKAAAYMALTDEERAKLKSQLFANLTDEEKAALIEKIGSGKGGALGHNVKGGKSKVFQSMTHEEKALIRAVRRSSRAMAQ